MSFDLFSLKLQCFIIWGTSGQNEGILSINSDHSGLQRYFEFESILS